MEGRCSNGLKCGGCRTCPVCFCFFAEPWLDLLLELQGENSLFGKPIWNKRWFILNRAGKLRYYANEKATKEKVGVSGSRLRCLMLSDDPIAFGLKLGQGEFDVRTVDVPPPETVPQGKANYFEVRALCSFACPVPGFVILVVRHTGSCDQQGRRTSFVPVRVLSAANAGRRHRHQRQGAAVPPSFSHHAIGLPMVFAARCPSLCLVALAVMPLDTHVLFAPSLPSQWLYQVGKPVQGVSTVASGVTLPAAGYLDQTSRPVLGSSTGRAAPLPPPPPPPVPSTVSSMSTLTATGRPVVAAPPRRVSDDVTGSFRAAGDYYDDEDLDHGGAPRLGRTSSNGRSSQQAQFSRAVAHQQAPLSVPAPLPPVSDAVSPASAASPPPTPRVTNRPSSSRSMIQAPSSVPAASTDAGPKQSSPQSASGPSPSPKSVVSPLFRSSGACATGVEASSSAPRQQARSGASPIASPTSDSDSQGLPPAGYAVGGRDGYEEEGGDDAGDEAGDSVEDADGDGEAGEERDAAVVSPHGRTPLFNLDIKLKVWRGAASRGPCSCAALVLLG